MDDGGPRVDRGWYRDAPVGIGMGVGEGSFVQLRGTTRDVLVVVAFLWRRHVVRGLAVALQGTVGREREGREEGELGR